MKIAIINDTHFGAKNDSPVLLEHFIQFFEKQFFPYCVKNNIERIIHLGDFFDRRKYINFNTLKQVRTRVIEPMEQMGMSMQIIIGNHDTYFRNTNKTNSPQELLEKYFHIEVVNEPKDLLYPDVTIGAVPWMCEDNLSQCIDYIKNSKAHILLGHYEIVGFEVLRGVYHESGLQREMFDRFETVMSGHFHLKSRHKNIEYLGTQYQMGFTDVNERKGFHVFDTKTRDLEFVQNKEELFHRIIYDDSLPEQLENLDFTQFHDKYVRLIVQRRNKPVFYEKFITKLNEVKPYDVTVVDEEIEMNYSSIDIDMNMDTITMICKEIDDLSEITNKDDIKSIIKDLYHESLTIDD